MMATADDIQNPLQRALDRYYPDGIPDLASCKIAGTGRMTVDSRTIDFSFTEVLELARRFRWEFESHDLKAFDCYDGDFAHQRIGDGKLQTFEGRECASFRTRLMMESAAFLIPLCEPGVKTKTVNPNTIEALFATGDRIWMQFDPETHHPSSVRARRFNPMAGKEVMMRIALSDWMRAARIVVPVTWRASWEDSEFMSQKLASFVPNPDISQVVFDPTALREFRVPR
jgi:hypothetical protein